MYARESAELADPRIDGALARRLRQQAGLTQAEVATRVGVRDGARVGAWERGDEQPSPGNVPRLAAALGVRTAELFDVSAAPCLAVLRRIAGLTLMKLAGSAGMPYARCQRLEKGLLSPTDDDAVRLAAALGVEVIDVRQALRRAAASVQTAAATRKPTTSAGP